MPKEPKRKMSTKTGHPTRHAPLGQVIQDDTNRGKFATMKKLRSSANHDDDDEVAHRGGDELLDVKTSKKILELSRDQQREMQMEEEERVRLRFKKGVSQSESQVAKKIANDSSDEEEMSNYEEEYGSDDDDLVQHDEGYVTLSSNIGLTAEEEALLSSMMGSQRGGNMGNEEPQRKTLADIIMAKIEEKETMANMAGAEEEEHDMGGVELPPKVIQVYTDIGKLLTHYTSGKLPKAFKVIPSLHNWEEVLYLTRPDQWTPQAMYAATRIFASNLNPKMAQRFYNLVLLDAVRADIYSNKKLNYHYYMALKKSVYKPAAFFKGILLPLCKEGCTLREAIIVASVLQRVSIPVHHSAVAIHKLALMEEYNGAASIFIKTLLNKKYSLPAPVISSLIGHFVRFQKDETSELPVLWHQALLVFVQRYKEEVGKEGKEKLRDLMKVHYHPKITVEIRRELFGSAAWKEERSMRTNNEDEIMSM
ncbi:hypothetical protein HJC23_004008 [Cyclotella cryptica]|uniref:Bystin n=1 Tax=Cyclotella cryptica TaxID=29204 RepID=A0ABD3QXJ9_9STRA|eukprot:CCRYP_001995-RA/>CCRYP_001995-RA protein AED:0.07 eAED:0.07 QI:0/0/0.5/1/1/1/2/100/478